MQVSSGLPYCLIQTGQYRSHEAAHTQVSVRLCGMSSLARVLIALSEGRGFLERDHTISHCTLIYRLFLLYLAARAGSRDLFVAYALLFCRDDLFEKYVI